MKGFIEFEFDLPEALLTSILSVFDGMDSNALVSENVAAIPDAQGVYQLLLRGSVVYIGKTDAEAGLRRRLERHARTIQHRHNLLPAEVTFKAVRVYVFTAMDLESQLIGHYKTKDSVSWNFSGFGSNDPGRERDTTNAKPEGFDATYPIDIDRQIDVVAPTMTSTAAVIAAVKEALPYTFRVQSAGKGSRKVHPEIASAEMALPPSPYTTRNLTEAIIASLPPGWQATLLAGRIIIYRENREYLFGTVIART